MKIIKITLTKGKGGLLSKYFKMVLFILVISFNGKCLKASDEVSVKDLVAEVRLLKERVAELEAEIAQLKYKEKGADQSVALSEELSKTKPEDIAGIREKFKGLNIGIGITYVLQGAINANNVNASVAGAKKEDVADGSYSVGVEFEKSFEDWGLAFICLETGDGAGAEDELEVFSNVNSDADDLDNAIFVSGAWYEHYFLSEQLTITAGKIDPSSYVDQNELANDACRQFLGRIFRNSPTIGFCDNSAGIRGLIAPAEVNWLEIEAQALDGDDGWEDIADHIFTSLQINFKPQLAENLISNWRIYSWLKDTDHTQWSNAAKTTENAFGLGVSLDQQITDKFSIFGRYSWVDPDCYDPAATSSSGMNFSLEHAWSTGFQLKGESWGRSKDHIACAVGMVMPSNEYKKYGGRGLTADDEGHFEAYYSWNLNDHLTVSPDLQVLWNPLGKDYLVNGQRRDYTITIIGCRGQLDF